MLHLRTPPLQVGDKDFAARLHEAKYKNAPRESASFNQNARTLHAKGDAELKCKDAPHQNRNCNQNARRSTRKRKFKPKCNRNARTLHARTRFSIKMKGHFKRERDFQTECNNSLRKSATLNPNAQCSRRERDLQSNCNIAPRRSAIFNEMARTFHAKARFSTKMQGRSTREPDFEPKWVEPLRESASLHRNAGLLHRRERFAIKMRGCSTQEHDLQRDGENALRESSKSKQILLHLRPPTLHVGPSASAVRPAVYNFYSTQERSFQSVRKDAPRESAVVNRNARTLHVRETHRNRLCFISGREPCTSAAPRASSRFCISGRQPYRPVARNQPLICKNVFASPTNASPAAAAAARSSSSNSTSRACPMMGRTAIAKMLPC